MRMRCCWFCLIYQISMCIVYIRTHNIRQSGWNQSRPVTCLSHNLLPTLSVSTNQPSTTGPARTEHLFYNTLLQLLFGFLFVQICILNEVERIFTYQLLAWLHLWPAETSWNSNTHFPYSIIPLPNHMHMRLHVFWFDGKRTTGNAYLWL